MKNKKTLFFAFLFAAGLTLFTGCKSGFLNSSSSSDDTTGHDTEPGVENFAESDTRWTGVAVSNDRRVFVNFPRWSDNIPYSVAELSADGSLSPYPNNAWNEYDPNRELSDQFVCVQSVYVDDLNRLWILDTGNPEFKGVTGEGGPKLIVVDLETDEITEVFEIPESQYRKNSYLNDVRVDTNRDVAYITDSGAGGLLVLDLVSESSFRVLQNHPSTMAMGTKITIDGRTWKRKDGTIPNVHADGIALSPGGDYLYYHALSGTVLYRIETEYLRQEDLEEERRNQVERLADTGPVDGMICDGDGNVYLTDLENSGIKVYTPDGTLYDAILDQDLSWPDSFAIGPDDDLYVTTSQIHLGENPPKPFGLYRLDLPLELE